MRIFKRTILGFIFGLSLISSVSKGQTWDWIETIRPGGNEYCWDVANDTYGNVFATGRVKATSIFGSGSDTITPPYISCCETDMFVAKYRNNGTLVWAKRDGGKQPDWGRSITTDGEGNVFVTGEYCDTANFGTNQVIGVGTYVNRNIFLAKYDSSGTCLWVKSAGNTAGHSKGYGVTADSLGNSYITGIVSGASDFDGKPIGYPGYPLTFIAKFSPNGNCIWTKGLGGTVENEGTDIKVDNIGNLFVTGSYKGTLYVNGFPYPGNSPSWADVYLIKMDTSGSFIWTTTAIGAYQDQATSVSVDSYGNSYISGTFANDLTFGTITINSIGWGSTPATANALADVFLAKYNSSGVFQWVKTIGNAVSGPPYDISSDGIEVTKSNKIMISGLVFGNVNMSGITLSLDTAYETSYVTAFDTLGNVLWYELDGGGGAAGNDAVARGISSDNDGNCYVGGEFYAIPGPMNFDSISVVSYSGYDAFIGKLLPPLDPLVSVDYNMVCPGQSINFMTIQDGSPLTYQWDLPGGTPSSSSLANPTVNYSVVGTYSATLIISNGHQADTSTLIIQVTPAACGMSVQEYAKNIHITIAPNPASSSATIYIDGIDLNSKPILQLYDYFGRSIGYPLLITDLSFPLNVEGIASGGYFLKITQNNVVVKTDKIIILH